MSSSGGDGPSSLVRQAVAAAHSQAWATVVAAAARTAGGDLSLAEDAGQEAFVQALLVWDERGVPRSPTAWLVRTAQRKVLDQLRRDRTLQRKLPMVAARQDERTGEAAPEVPAVGEDSAMIDDRLRLVFTCCHPALATDAQVGLTLRLVGGLTTEQIAAGLLVKESAMAARLTRAKHKIVAAGIPYRVPGDADLPERLDAVLTVIHLISTTGHTAPSGSTLQRPDLAAQALDLARMLAVLMPDEPEALGLLALLEMTQARQAAREGPDGTLVLLADQDRSRWDAALIERGLAHLQRAGQRLGPDRPPGRYLLQAGLAAVHAEAATFDDTDWAAAVLLYDRLLERWPSPVVALNRAVAISFRDGPETGLAELDALATDPRLAQYHYMPAARADLLAQLGRNDDARAAYEAALALVTNDAERTFLLARADALGEGSHRPT